MITIVEQTTAERNEETKKLFESIKPYLDDGFNYRRALILVGRIGKNTKLNKRTGWFRDLTEYGGSQGYDYYDFKFKQGVKKPVLAWDYPGLYL